MELLEKGNMLIYFGYASGFLSIYMNTNGNNNN